MSNNDLKLHEVRECPKCGHDHDKGFYCFGCVQIAKYDDAFKYISCNWQGGSKNYPNYEEDELNE